jgi:hypothetical protein
MNRNIGRRIQRTMARMQKNRVANSGPVVLHWRTRSGSSANFDPHLQASKVGTTYAEASETKVAFIHYVSIHTTGYTRFTQIQTGDVILDFIGDVDIDGKEGLQFEIGRVGNTPGKLYVQKNAGDELAQSWDVHANNQAITRTVLVTLKS